MPEREHELADANPVRVGHGQRGQPLDAVELEQREVDPGIAPDDLAGEAPPVEEPHLSTGDVFHDVRVGHDHALGVDDEPGTARATLLRLLALLGGRRLPPYAHVNDRRLQALGEVGEQVVEPSQLRRDIKRSIGRSIGGEDGPGPSDQNPDQRHDRHERSRPATSHGASSLGNCPFIEYTPWAPGAGEPRASGRLAGLGRLRSHAGRRRHALPGRRTGGEGRRVILLAVDLALPVARHVGVTAPGGRKIAVGHPRLVGARRRGRWQRRQGLADRAFELVDGAVRLRGAAELGQHEQRQDERGLSG